jgi:hypothetical protein
MNVKFLLFFVRMDHETNPEFLRQNYQLEMSDETNRAVQKKA